MLGRAADGLYWMFRYTERAENIARLIDAAAHMALTHTDPADDGWDSVLNSVGGHAAYCAKYEGVTGPQVIDFLLRDCDNPSSVLNAVYSARNNARTVRTALTRDAWESTNEFWLEMSRMLARPVKPSDLPETLDAIKRHTALIRGAFHGTMLRNEIFDFARIGTFIERADNTARILDVKYYVLLPAVSFVGSSLDNVQWESILRSVSAHRSYRWVYDADIQPAKIAEYLILSERMPRALTFCYQKIRDSLTNLEREYGERHAAHDTVARTLATLENRVVADIFDEGLHEFLLGFIERNNQLGSEVAEAYRFY
ncbi:alpha-E domain-containing protein [Gimibacter soli]|uniref:Alpha-E domain-containing protein n=1 Tax=Gimibacter soli TaxID=3024400 RepID=A0AAE9XQZ6_9PROT|nr:alpha-E domain-containing protein [Gimibacter soli]WCL55587.1 alpha-E domain-containing protein [Gimibacter soli]